MVVCLGLVSVCFIICFVWVDCDCSLFAGSVAAAYNVAVGAFGFEF